MFQELSQLAQDPDVKEVLDAPAYVHDKIFSTLDQCFELISEQPSKTPGPLQEVFVEDFKKELGDIAAASAARPIAAKPFRRPLPKHLPREAHTHMPEHETCPQCGGRLRVLGEDVAEMLEHVRAYFKVIRHVRPKLSCDACDRILQAPAPSRPIDRGLAGPGLLAHVLVSKHADHLPLYRQAEIYSREGLDLDRSTLAGWVGATSESLAPLVEAIRVHVMSASKLHADDTPVPRARTGQRQDQDRAALDLRPGRPAVPAIRALRPYGSPTRLIARVRTHGST